MASEPDQPAIKKNWVQRSLTATFLILYFIGITYIGLTPIWLTSLVIQIKCFQEIITIAYNYKKLPEIPLFRTLNWYFLFVANYFFCGATFAQYLKVFAAKYLVVNLLFKYHKFLSFCLYMTGMIWFLSLLRRKVIRQQFSLLAWVHFLCIIIVLQSYMIIQNLFEGLVWVVIPVTLVFVNDIFAYIFGRFYGKTPLIKVSPKKTLEGFLGGGLGALTLGILISWAVCHIDHMVCPTKFIPVEDSIKMTTECTRSFIFQPISYSLGLFSVNYYPFLFHIIILTLFASLIAPFGGFCASGFKRAFNTKDFGDLIPGHGGMMDRFDCQYLMATFVNVYIISFVRNYSVERIFVRVLYLEEDNQVKFYNLLKNSLTSQGIL
ncbi:phosphatidate cytidylyltransferase, photoreceptor-specific-like [Euwallacea fornicatus]|uniref:phosphatidate cytidylyltransferase, photoreceptor-specific-like n=1 Tax=Euwallacea fornicatus TaxID=995702 RepID=UPI003390137D